jgi:hypothetical protein
MWRSALRDLPADDEPVACWERDELYVAKRIDGLWYECSTYGDLCLSRGAPLLREPEQWAHLPASLVKLKLRE